jgi:hypothetical protein
MRLLKFRFTVRRIMVLVAVVALLMAGGIEARRLWLLRVVYQDKVAYHARRVRDARRNLRVVSLLRSRGITINNMTRSAENEARWNAR